MKNLSRILTIASACAGLAILICLATVSCKKNQEALTSKPTVSLYSTAKWEGNTGKKMDLKTAKCPSEAGNCLGEVVVNAPRKLTDLKAAILADTLGGLLSTSPGYYFDLTSPADTITQHFIDGIVNGTIYYGLKTDMSLPADKIVLIMGEEPVSNTSYDVVMPISGDL